MTASAAGLVGAKRVLDSMPLHEAVAEAAKGNVRPSV